MGRPACLLLDEPSMGLAPMLADQILEVVANLRSLGVTALLIEQNAFAALSIADRGYVMETGRITISGPAHELIEDQRIREAYLGL
jgi:branched-chain amino acid transport system ATP-binding protein